MLKPLFCVCVFGLFVTNAFAGGSDEWFDDYNDADSYEYSPNFDGKQRIHKIEELESDEKVIKDIEQFREEVEDDINDAENEDYDNIVDYQFEDNRSESDIKRNSDKEEDEKENRSIFSEILEPGMDDEQNDKEDPIDKETNQMDNGQVVKYLDEKKDSSEKDIIEETKAILKEDDSNEFEKIIVQNEGDSNIKDIAVETSKLLDETDDNFDDRNKKTQSAETDNSEMTENQSEEANKPYDVFKSNLEELRDSLNKISGDSNDNINDDVETFDDSYETQLDYYEIGDDELDTIFADKSQEKTNDIEKLTDSVLENKTVQPIFYLNDALSVGDSNTTQLPETTIDTKLSEDTKTSHQSEVTENDEQISTKKSEDELTTPSLMETSQGNTEQVTEKPDANLTDEDANHTNEIYPNTVSFNVVEVHLNVNETTLVMSPNYPNAYPTNQITDYRITGDGMGIEMNVTDFAINSFVGDYVLFLPGQTDKDGSDGILATYTLKSERRFRFTDVDRMFIRFEAKEGMQFQRGFNMSLKMIMPRTDVVEDEPTEEGPEIRTSEDTLTVNIGGVSLDGFFAIEEDFRRLIADMATMYINAMGMEPGLNATLDVTEIRSRGICFHNWPGSEQCAEIAFAVPLRYDDESLETRFTAQDLRAMWDSYSRLDPFAVRLELLGVVEFTYPDERSVLTVWLVVGAGVLISAAMLAFALWRYSCFEDYTKMPSYSDCDSLNDKRVLDLYPTPHQTLPPLYSEDVQWADEKYDIGKDHGYSNNSFLRDDLFDVDSDDDTLRTQNGYRPGAISPRDIYHV